MTIRTVTITYDDSAMHDKDAIGTISSDDPEFQPKAAILFNDKDVQMENPGGATNGDVINACGTVAKMTYMDGLETAQKKAKEAAIDAAVDFDSVGKGE